MGILIYFNEKINYLLFFVCNLFLLMWGLKDCIVFNDSYNIFFCWKVYVIVKMYVIGYYRENFLLKNVRGLFIYIVIVEIVL